MAVADLGGEGAHGSPWNIKKKRKKREKRERRKKENRERGKELWAFLEAKAGPFNAKIWPFGSHIWPFLAPKPGPC